MAYNDNIPQSSDLISKSQSQILANFQGIDSTVFGFARNHVALTDGTSGGLHKEIDFLAAVGDPTLSGFVSSLYPKTVSNVELFYKNAAAVYQLTNLSIASTSGSGFSNFSITTPWGIKLSWGLLTITTGSSPFTGTVTFATAFSAVPSIQVTAHNVNGVGVSTENESTTGFTAYCTSGNAARYFAIGT